MYMPDAIDDPNWFVVYVMRDPRDVIECGYETSGEWEQVLDGVEPDFSRSRYPEKVYF